MRAPTRRWPPKALPRVLNTAAARGIAVIPLLGDSSWAIYPTAAEFVIRALAKTRLIMPGPDGVIRLALDIEPEELPGYAGADPRDPDAMKRQTETQATYWRNIFVVVARVRETLERTFEPLGTQARNHTEVTLFVSPHVTGLLREYNRTAPPSSRVLVPRGTRLMVMAYSDNPNASAEAVSRSVQDVAADPDTFPCVTVGAAVETGPGPKGGGDRSAHPPTGGDEPRVQPRVFRAHAGVGRLGGVAPGRGVHGLAVGGAAGGGLLATVRAARTAGCREVPGRPRDDGASRGVLRAGQRPPPRHQSVGSHPAIRAADDQRRGRGSDGGDGISNHVGNGSADGPPREAGILLRSRCASAGPRPRCVGDAGVVDVQHAVRGRRPHYGGEADDRGPFGAGRDHHLARWSGGAGPPGHRRREYSGRRPARGAGCRHHPVAG